MSINLSKSSTWKQLDANWDKGFEQLTLEEQQTIALYWLEAETMNGTLDQYFWNSSGDLAPIALAGLKRLNCINTHALLQKTMFAINGDHCPTDREKRMQCLESYENKHGNCPAEFMQATNFIQDFSEDFLCVAMNDLDQLYLNNKPPF